jgi:hypothetical protein
VVLRDDQPCTILTAHGVEASPGALCREFWEISAFLGPVLSFGAALYVETVMNFSYVLHTRAL